MFLQPKNWGSWVGVRNYPARNFLRDSMQVGDGVLSYHSSCYQPGIVGIAQAASAAFPDPTRFDLNSPYQDAKSKSGEPRWLLVELNNRLAATSMCKITTHTGRSCDAAVPLYANSPRLTGSVRGFLQAQAVFAATLGDKS